MDENEFPLYEDVPDTESRVVKQANQLFNIMTTNSRNRRGKISEAGKALAEEYYSCIREDDRVMLYQMLSTRLDEAGWIGEEKHG